MTKSIKAGLLAGAAILAGFSTPALAAAGDAAADQSSTRGSTGQANDASSLTTSDIIVTGSRTAEAAPITASLTTTQPQAAVSRDYIDNVLVPTADFNQIIALTPGASITGTSNGVGFSETKVQIRGFQDGEYNVTYDSIPFGDSNNPTHHSTAFFPSNTIETVVVDRGPGNASQLGQATYGGNVNLYSRAVADTMGGMLELSTGSFNTFLARGEYQSGKIASLNDAQFVITGEFLRSNGALTFSPVNSKNIFAKAVIPIGASNVLTILSTYNRNFYYQSDTQSGATCGNASATQFFGQLNANNCTATSNIGQYGRNYSLGNDPTKQDYFRYNRTDKTTDFSIIRLQSDLGSGITLDNRLYMYAYTNNTLSGQTGAIVTGFNRTTVPVTASNPNGVLITAVNGTGVPGYDKMNKYRNLGYIGQLNWDFGMGRLRVGTWYEHSRSDRHLYDLEMGNRIANYRESFNNGSGTAAANLLPDPGYANLRYDQKSGWDQYQFFGELEIRPIEGLSITPGIKYVHFQRSITAIVNQTSRSPIDTKATWTKTLPFATVNYALTPSLSAYFQYAQGMYVPDLSSFYQPTNNSAQAAQQTQTLASIQPQTSTNYQAGYVWHQGRISMDGDIYLIEVNNKLAADPTIGTVGGAPAGTLVNLGQVRYRGIEGQVSYMPVDGLTLFANGSINEALNRTTNAQIAKAPKSTAAGGIFYNHGPLRISFTQKFTGPAYAAEYKFEPVARLYRIRPYSIGDFAASVDVGQLRLGLNVSNVFNNRAITAIGTSSSGAPTQGGIQTGYGQADTFQFLPPRSFMVDARFKF